MLSVFAVVGQQYSTDVNKEHVILGNSALLKCVVPSFVADFVSVLAWEDDKGTKIYPSESYGTSPTVKSIPTLHDGAR